jgi:hypothetical protein
VLLVAGDRKLIRHSGGKSGAALAWKSGTPFVTAGEGDSVIAIRDSTLQGVALAGGSTRTLIEAIPVADRLLFAGATPVLAAVGPHSVTCWTEPKLKPQVVEIVPVSPAGVSISPDGLWLAIPSAKLIEEGNDAGVAFVSTVEPLRKTRGLRAVQLTALMDTGLCFAAVKDGSIQALNRIESGVRTVVRAGSPASHLVATSTGRKFAVARRDFSISIHGLDGEEIYRIGSDRQPRAIAFSADGRYLMVAARSYSAGIVKLYRFDP